MSADPFAWLRSHAPIHRDGGSGAIILSRAGDIDAAMRSRSMSAAGGQRERRERGGVPESLLTTDGDRHRQLRAASAPLVDRERIARLSRAWSERLVLRAATLRGPIDVSKHLTEPWATEVLCDVVGVEDPADRTALGSLMSTTRPCLDPQPRPDVAARAELVNRALGQWLRAYVARTEDGVVRELRAGGTDQEVVSLLSLSLVGGWSPLADSAAAALMLLARGHGVPGTGASRDAFTREVLRWLTPVPHVARSATEPVEVPSGTVPPGFVVLSLASANRDEDLVEAPAEFRPEQGRAGGIPFGLGAHYCLGAPIVQSALDRVLSAARDPRWPTMRAKDEELEIAPGFPRALTRTEVTLG